MAILIDKTGNEAKTERNRFTRMCIGEAAISLMKKTDFEKIKISDIVKKAGVSRMTYYNYYASKEDVLNDYLDEIISEYMQKCMENPAMRKLHEYEYVLFTLKFFDRYAEFLMALSEAGFYSIILKALNKFMLQEFMEEYKGSVYELYYYAGALLNTFIKWEENGKDITAEELAKTIVSFEYDVP